MAYRIEVGDVRIEGFARSYEEFLEQVNRILKLAREYNIIS